MAVRTWGLRRFPVWPALVAAIALLAGCGAPEFTYVTNSADHTYLKIPNSWQPLDEKSMAEGLGLDPAVSIKDRGMWLVGYDADAAPSSSHLFGQHAPSPALFVQVTSVVPAARGQLSLDKLRDMFLAVTPMGRQEQASPQLTDFGLRSDEVLTPKGLHGVHVVYQYRLGGGPTQIFDKTAYVNDDASKLYVFFLRCSLDCYQQRQQEIKSVVSSFTVRESP